MVGLCVLLGTFFFQKQSFKKIERSFFLTPGYVFVVILEAKTHTLCHTPNLFWFHEAPMLPSSDEQAPNVYKMGGMHIDELITHSFSH